MGKYIIKNNLPTESDHTPDVWQTANEARTDFMDIINILSAKYHTKVVFRNKPLRGTIQVEIDGFFYYVELYKVTE